MGFIVSFLFSVIYLFFTVGRTWLRIEPGRSYSDRSLSASQPLAASEQHFHAPGRMHAR